MDDRYVILETDRLQLREMRMSDYGMKPVDTIVKNYRGVVMPHLVFCVERESVKCDGSFRGYGTIF